MRVLKFILLMLNLRGGQRDELLLLLLLLLSLVLSLLLVVLLVALLVVLRSQLTVSPFYMFKFK